MSKFKLPELPYAYNALESFIDEKTMVIHHSMHHQGYVDKLNSALDGHEALQKKSVEDLLKNLDSVPEGIRTTVRNTGGGHYNHSFFWEILAKDIKLPENNLSKAINFSFGSFENFKKEFSSSAVGLFGSGWTWLVLTPERKLKIINTLNQESPISNGLKPILTLDVWEHAYYLKYQNRRAEYIEAFFNVINWEKVGKLFSYR